MLVSRQLDESTSERRCQEGLAVRGLCSAASALSGHNAEGDCISRGAKELSKFGLQGVHVRAQKRWVCDKEGPGRAHRKGAEGQEGAEAAKWLVHFSERRTKADHLRGRSGWRDGHGPMIEWRCEGFECGSERCRRPGFKRRVYLRRHGGMVAASGLTREGVIATQHSK